MKKQGLALVALAAVALVGCGSSPQTDASNLLSGIGGGIGGQGSNTALMAKSEAEAPANVVTEIHNQLEGAAWLGALHADSAATSADPRISAATPWSTCPTIPSSACTVSCPTSSQLKFACSSTASGSSTCNGTKYTISNPNYTVLIDVTNVTGTGTSATGTMTLGLNFNATVSGGSFSGGTLACALNMSVDISQLKAGTATLAPNCNDTNFSCTYGGTTLSCSDLKAKMASAKTSCS